MSEAAPSNFPRVPSGVFEDPLFLKKYELERELGVGGAGAVVCARHRELDERVAIKFLLSGSENAEAVARFRREARAAHRVKSEHVVGIVDVSTTSTGVPYVVMEYLEGSDLERMLLESPDGQLPVRDAIEFVLQACEALAECHAIGIVHRDLKPSNLFCTHGADGLPIVKVLDFGISKLGTVTVNEAMTGRHAIMGSPRYMSPEQFATPINVDRRADIWALGIILYELVTGAAPFVGNTLIGIWEHVKTGIPKPIEELRRDAPRGLGPIVMRCLEKSRDQRYQSVAELAKALLPLGTDRMRATVARIVRIVEMPGVTTTSLSLPPSGQPSMSAGATSVSVHSGAPARGSKNLAFALVAAGAAIGLVVLVGSDLSGSKKITSPASSANVVSMPPVATVAVTPSSAAVAGATPSASLELTARANGPSAPAPESSASVPLSAPRRSRPSPPPAAAESHVSAAAPASSVAATPSAAVESTPPRVAPPAEMRAPASSAKPIALPASVSPWITDIVEERKGKVGGSP